MKTIQTNSWTRHGFSMLWNPGALAGLSGSGGVLSMREFLSMRKAWPETLPGAGGDALVVAGIEGCLDSLSEEDAIQWLRIDLRTAILSFQEHYDGQAALILWIASGRTRIAMDLAGEEYFWKTSPGRDAARLPLGQCLWSGAASDVARILISKESAPDVDGEAYAGLHHPRIS